MVEPNDRILPVGIQSFEKIREEDICILTRQILSGNLPTEIKRIIILSRPRRFGKSVLVDTLEAYFMGKKANSSRD